MFLKSIISLWYLKAMIRYLLSMSVSDAWVKYMTVFWCFKLPCIKVVRDPAICI